MLMKSSKVLRELAYTLVQSIFPALNLLFLMVMLIFMWAVLGMQVFGQLPHQEYINVHDNFDNIFNAMRFMFQISTGQDFMYLVQELEGHGSFTVHPFVFIFTFYVAVKWVVLNLLIAVLLENFENNFILDNMDLAQEHIDEFGEVFATFTDDGVYDILSSVQKASEFVRALADLGNPLASVVYREPYWENRLLFELDMLDGKYGADFFDEPSKAQKKAEASLKERRFENGVEIGFYEVLLVLALTSQDDGSGSAYAGLDYAGKMRRKNGLTFLRTQHAVSVIKIQANHQLFTRRTNKQAAAGEITEKERFNLVSASKTVAILRLNTAVRLNIVKPDDGPTAALTRPGDDPILEIENPIKAS